MTVYYSSKFAREYKRLPQKIKKQAENKELIFRKDPFHSSLNTHKLTGRLKSYWAFSITHSYRVIFEFRDKDIVWFHSVGTHGIYR